MRGYRTSCLFSVIGMLALVTPVSAAEDCTLKMFTVVDTVSTASGGMLVPITLSGAQKKLLLDTGGFFSEISPQVADELMLERRHVGLMQYDAAGNAVDQAVTASDFSIGKLKAKSMPLMVGASGLGGDGVLAPDILKAYDVELDFPHNKLSLISPDHCKGQVVYWPHAAVAAVPMRVTPAGHIVFPAELDGHNVRALLDTSATRNALSIRAAQEIFGLNTSASSHRFKTLSIEGIAVNNPEIALLPDLTRNSSIKKGDTSGRLISGDARSDEPDILIGMSMLKQLHVYIAYNEQMLYITAGDAALPGGHASLGR
jgi:predicted aspartyl protease